MGEKSAQSRRAAERARGNRRLGLVGFGALLVALFVVFAVTVGIGTPSVPAGDVALVEDVPEDISHISKKELDRALVQQAAQTGEKKAPKPGSDKYVELRDGALSELLNATWIKGEAEEMGISVTDKQIADELEQIKQQNFKTPRAYKKFLKESKYTQDDVDQRVELQILSTQLQEQVTGEAPKPSEAEISNYYEAEKGTQFTTAASRDVRVIVNSKEAKVKQARAALQKDNSKAAWKKAAAKFSDDPTTKSKGGEQPGITEEFVQGELKEAIFGSATGELVGPVNVQGKYMLIEVTKLNPEKVQTLDEARAQITSTLEQQKQQEYFSEFVADWQSKWSSRTFCADGYLVEQCDNFKGSGRPANAPEACFEANPKTPATACPALVTPTSPALPGSVTVAKPQGERLPQRPRPEGLSDGADGGSTETISPTGE